MRRFLSLTLATSIACLTGLAAQPSPLVTDVRAAIKANDLPQAAKAIATYRAGKGVTAEMLEALSWMGRGALAAKDLEGAEKYARETHQLSIAMLKTRPLDQDARLPIALGAAIEVLGQLDAQRGARSEAVSFLRGEVAKFRGTSIEKRLQKNINLLTLEGQPAPALDVAEYLGPKPPSLASLKGKVVVLFFWAHWCSDCKAQGPILADLAAKYRDQGLVVFAPTQRFGYVAGGKPAPADEEMRYIDAVRQQFYPVLAGQPVPVSEANHLRYGVSSTPTLVLVDRAGLIRMYNPGRLTMEQLEPRIKSLLGS
ncbi:MAG: TlpA family protein disulfide reductase [Planctomycetota bacterium]|nr:TlpA family protein disulfide reductase [Planctomycetota bacterium]